MSKSANLLIEGFKGLRHGSLLILTSFIIMLLVPIVSIWLAAPFIYYTVVKVVPITSSMTHHNIVGATWCYGMVTLLIVIAALVLVLCGIALWLKASGRLRDYSDKFSIGRIGLMLQVIALIILLIYIPIAILGIY